MYIWFVRKHMVYYTIFKRTDNWCFKTISLCRYMKLIYQRDNFTVSFSSEKKNCAVHMAKFIVVRLIYFLSCFYLISITRKYSSHIWADWTQRPEKVFLSSSILKNDIILVHFVALALTPSCWRASWARLQVGAGQSTPTTRARASCQMCRQATIIRWVVRVE